MPSCLKLLHLKLRPTDSTHYIIIVIARIILGADFHLRACHYFLWLRTILSRRIFLLCLIGREGEIIFSYRNSPLMSTGWLMTAGNALCTYEEKLQLKLFIFYQLWNEIT
jgi:hypothetical protein